MATESFADFADKLQHELEQDTGLRFGVLEIGLFTDLKIPETVIQERTPTREEAEKIVAVSHAVEPKETNLPKPEIQTVEQVMAQTMPLPTVVEKPITTEEAQQLITHMEQKGYITKTGRVKETLKNALMTGTLDLPANATSSQTASGSCSKLDTPSINSHDLRNCSSAAVICSEVNFSAIILPRFYT